MKRLIDILIMVAIWSVAGYAGYMIGSKEKAEAESITICDNCPHIGWFGEPNSCAAFRLVNSKEVSEPNELEGSGFHIWEPEEYNKVSLDFIPTWPDYIELEKDLVIDIGTRLDEPGDKKWWFGRGTKIYFKE